MAVIVPTITVDTPDAANAALTKYAGFTKRIQYDASDGTLAPTRLADFNALAVPEGVKLDLHLMSAQPSSHLEAVLALKPHLCIVHAEVSDNVLEIFEKLRGAGIKTGLALLKTTYPGKVAPLIEAADHVMIFAGDLGRQGATIDLMQTEKVSLIKAIKLEVELGWDGGINLSNIRALAHAGVDVLNVGSALAQSEDAAAMYQSLVVENERKGVLV